jgi:hypothetical protein
MRPATIVTLSEIESSNWFVNVGVRDTTAAIVLRSWQEAIEHCSSLDWRDLNLEAANQLRERLLERSPTRFNEWNDVVRGVKPAAQSLAMRKIEEVVRDNGLPKSFENCVEWDMIHLAIEAEYADVFPPAYFASQAYWYVNGHFPCGWDGRFPDGKLIVY